MILCEISHGSQQAKHLKFPAASTVCLKEREKSSTLALRRNVVTTWERFHIIPRWLPALRGLLITPYKPMEPYLGMLTYFFLLKVHSTYF